MSSSPNPSVDRNCFRDLFVCLSLKVLHYIESVGPPPYWFDPNVSHWDKELSEIETTRSLTSEPPFSPNDHSMCCWFARRWMDAVHKKSRTWAIVTWTRTLQERARMAVTKKWRYSKVSFTQEEADEVVYNALREVLDIMPGDDASDKVHELAQHVFKDYRTYADDMTANAPHDDILRRMCFNARRAETWIQTALVWD